MIERSEWGRLKLERQLPKAHIPAQGSVLMPPCDEFMSHPPEGACGHELGRRARFELRHPDGRLAYLCQECMDEVTRRKMDRVTEMVRGASAGQPSA